MQISVITLLSSITAFAVMTSASPIDTTDSPYRTRENGKLDLARLKIGPRFSLTIENTTDTQNQPHPVIGISNEYTSSSSILIAPSSTSSIFSAPSTSSTVFSASPSSVIPTPPISSSSAQATSAFTTTTTTSSSSVARPTPFKSAFGLADSGISESEFAGLKFGVA
ncbi:hypothetical protein BXZ70DRAFT_437812 [Cristinia sonorae]|uniref:Uncharacterized protein n=1 Tax=Cristinia sonorae TaxID=1940300 RepID=A0A8K0XME0_9AGAR|nr:hypothetical protein BXZ70DRAFT_437812 [Cristinia sonorae]